MSAHDGSERCPDCGHVRYKHRHLGAPTQSLVQGDPVPCWCPLFDADGRLVGHCGCTRVFL